MTTFRNGLHGKEREDQKRRVQKLHKKWVRPIGLAWWNIQIVFYDLATGDESTDSTDVAMACEVDWRYMMATIRVNLDCIETMSDDKLEKTFVHELMHIFLGELRGDTKEDHDHEERVATQLASSFIWAVKNVKGK